MSRFFYDPFTEFDRLFDDAFAARFPTGQQGNNQNQGQQVARRDNRVSNFFQGPFKPRMDLQENRQNNTVTATFELPGLKKEDINIDIHNNRLTISGESKVSSEHDEAGYAVRERSYGSFSRTLQLPAATKPEDIKASVENGVLTVTFPKSSPEQAPKRIAIS